MHTILCFAALAAGSQTPAELGADAIARKPNTGIAVRTTRGLQFYLEDGAANGVFPIPQRPGVDTWAGPISPDGKHVVLARAAPSEATTPYRVSVAPLDGGPEVEFAGEYRTNSFVWAADGVFVGIRHEYEGLPAPGHYRHTRFDVARRSATVIGIHARADNARDTQYPEPYPQSRLGLRGASRSGKSFVATDRQWGGPAGGLFLTASDGTVVRRLTPEGIAAGGGVFSPDGRTVLFTLIGDNRPNARRLSDGLYTLDVESGKMALVAGTNEPDGSCYWSSDPFTVAWRPDGARVAVQHVRHVDPEWWPNVFAVELFVCDPDGGNRRDVIRREVVRPGDGFRLHGWR